MKLYRYVDYLSVILVHDKRAVGKVKQFFPALLANRGPGLGRVVIKRVIALNIKIIHFAVIVNIRDTFLHIYILLGNDLAVSRAARLFARAEIVLKAERKH